MICEDLVVYKWQPKCVWHDDNDALRSCACGRLCNIGFAAVHRSHLAGWQTRVDMPRKAMRTGHAWKLMYKNEAIEI